MKSLAVSALAAMALCGNLWSIQRHVLVSAFSVTRQSSHHRTARASDGKVTERSYGQHIEVDIALPTIPYPSSSSSSSSTTLAPRRRDSTFQTTSRSKIRQYDRMVRPKSLNSSSNKIESANTVVSKKKHTKFPDLLTKDEEIQLIHSLRAMRAAVRVRDDLVAQQQPHPSNEEEELIITQPLETEWALACGYSVQRLRRVLVEGHDARVRLVSANGGLVRSIAKKHFYNLQQAGSILTLQDMVQEGNLGLMEAAERFDPNKGFRFSTYATWWVRQRILKSISEYSRVIRLPAHVHSMLSKINKARRSMEKEIGRPPSVPELAHYLEMSVDKLRMYTDSSRSVLSLEVPVSRPSGSFKEDWRTLGDKIASDSPTPQENAEVESLRRAIREVVNELATRERDVLVTRFGLDDGRPKTVEETSKRLGISRDRVRLVETRALNKLRHPQRNYKLKEYMRGSSKEEEDMERQQRADAELSPERIWSF